MFFSSSSLVAAGALLAHLRLASRLAPPHRLLHFTRPVPSLSLESIEKHHRGTRVYPGMPLNEHERVRCNFAKREGFLLLGPHCGPSLANAYYKYCWDVRRPYVAVHRDGIEVVVDVGPVTGLASKKSDEAIDRVLSVYRPILAALPSSHQVVNAETLRAQSEKMAPAALAGSNEARIADSASTASDAFSVFVPQRREAWQLAKALHLKFTEASGRSTPLQLEAEVAERKAARVEGRERLVLRKLRRLVQQPIAVKNLRVKQGVLDGFLRAEKLGTAEEAIRTAAKVLDHRKKTLE